MLPKGAYRCGLFRLSIRPSVHPLCPEQNLKTLGHNLFKLHGVVEGIESECSAKEPKLCLAFGVIAFCSSFLLLILSGT
jgi:hypothetical protein